MKKAHIIYYNYLTPDGSAMSVGGIQTYISNLIRILKEEDYEVIIHQLSNVEFQKKVNGIIVYGYNILKRYGCRYRFIQRVQNKITSEEDLVIYGCDTCCVKKIKNKSIAIQHGISWDKPEEHCSIFKYIYIYMKKYINALSIIKRSRFVDELVCVDYNFVNWYRALVPYPQIRLNVIPNFCRISENYPQKIKSSDTINIIFARRFFPYRGTRIFSNVMLHILNEYDNIKVTIAGDGPDENYLKNVFKGYKNVNFIKYNSDESMAIHMDKDIAIIPTLGSEGTSLSLLEAMATGCAPICTNVGGMTNIILNGYNGIMISPNEDELYEAVKKLINNKQLRESISKRAFDTVCQSFNYNNWRMSWKEIIIKHSSKK